MSRKKGNIEKKDAYAMKVLALPEKSNTIVIACLVIQALAIYCVITDANRRLWILVTAFIFSGFLTDLVSGLAHLSFDYIWPPATPILGPIAIEFRQHHEGPTLDPSNLMANLSRGAYVALPVALLGLIVSELWTRTILSFFAVTSLVAASAWIIGFHQIHSYAHMGQRIHPDEFNLAVAKAALLPAGRQKAELARLFETAGIPWLVRFLQRSRIFIRPEIHWQHHISFERDFSSINGWSDSMMNPLYQRRVLSCRRKAATIIPGDGLVVEKISHN